uniref:Wsv432-like protein n=1 Tax=Trachysalambria curvirostris nimavirus TaxID=2984282 RepID=A0A9C7BR48_9VIRU|nr:MAG: wsv432-like protein [Trachysalambria curvirostris nimavirus]
MSAYFSGIHFPAQIRFEPSGPFLLSPSFIVRTKSSTPSFTVTLWTNLTWSIKRSSADAMSERVPSLISSNTAIATSAHAIAIHSLAERIVPDGVKSKQGSRISRATAYLTLPESIRQVSSSSGPIAYDPLNKRYYPDPCDDVLNDSSITVKEFLKSVGVADLGPLYV